VEELIMAGGDKARAGNLDRADSFNVSSEVRTTNKDRKRQRNGKRKSFLEGVQKNCDIIVSQKRQGPQLLERILGNWRMEMFST